MSEIIFEKDVLCPIKWKCVKLQREICPFEEAIYDKRFGWICDCGIRVKLKSTKEHIIIEKGYCEGILRINEKRKKRH